jgi:hypothetical protein
MTHDGEDLVRWIEESTKRASERALKKYMVGSSLAFVLLLGGLAFAGNAWIEELQSGLHGACDRVNVLRAQSNLSDSVSFTILSSAAQRETRLVKGDPKNASTHQRSADVLAGEAKRLTVTRMTDCDRAVSDPDSYSTPSAGPIGDPLTGERNEEVEEILLESEAMIRNDG